MGRRFVDQRRRDPYYRAAQREGLRSRASFKLASLAERFPIFHRGDRVLDLGAAPGGWSVVARSCLGSTGHIVAVDPRPIEPIEGRLGGDPFDVVLSDMSPQISGAYATDHARSVALARAAYAIAQPRLREGGVFVAKVFAGDLLGDLEAELRPEFERFLRTKPPASREHSSELYLVGIGFRPPMGSAR